MRCRFPSWLASEYVLSVTQPCHKLTIEEKSARVVVRCNALKQGQRIADSVGSSCRKLRRVEQRVDRDDLL